MTLGLFGFVGRLLGRFRVFFALDSLVYLFAVDRNVLRGIDADANLVPFDT